MSSFIQPNVGTSASTGVAERGKRGFSAGLEGHFKHNVNDLISKSLMLIHNKAGDTGNCAFSLKDFLWSFAVCSMRIIYFNKEKRYTVLNVSRFYTRNTMNEFSKLISMYCISEL